MSKKELDLSRRKLLAGLGTAGVAAAGAGLGTTAYLNDTESFTGNSLTAGELNLVVDWWTDQHQGSAGSSSNSGTLDGNPADYTYEVSDVKPGDTGTIAFCPKIIDNPAWLWIGSENGLTSNENGYTEPEPVDDNGEGELEENTQVTVSYANNVSIEDGEVVCDVIDDLNNPEDYTVANLASDLETGFLIDPNRTNADPDPYPASPDVETQVGPCICIEWEVPTSVGNEIQTDSFELDFSLNAQQSRHNAGGGTNNPFSS